MRIIKNLCGSFMLGSLYFLLLACLIPFLPLSLWFFDLIAHFQSYYFVLSLLLFSVAALLWCKKTRRKNRILQQFLGVSLLALLLSGASLAPYMPRPQKAVDNADAPILRLMQVNVFKFNRKHDVLLHFIHKYKPDLITIAEATPEWRDALKELTAAKDGWPYMIDQAKPGSNGMLVLSRYEFTQQESLYPATDTHPAILFRITVNGRDILIASLHPLSPVSKMRFKHRDSYMDGVAASLQQAQDGPVIVAGDMNMTMYTPSYKSFLRKTGLRNARNGRGLYPTWPVYVPLPTRFKTENLMIPHLLRIPIDHVFYKGDIRLLEFTALPAIGSDHLATLTRFSVP
tara:strand:- start:842 stop:1873 length:1032 start_codon:yes stop_codon:yes gene_type:complete